MSMLFILAYCERMTNWEYWTYIKEQNLIEPEKLTEWGLRGYF